MEFTNFILIFLLICSFSLVLQDAYSTDSFSLGIGLDPTVPIIDEPVTISCVHPFDHKYDILVITRNSEVLFSESTTITEMTFLTDDAITVTCTVNNDGNTDIIYSFTPTPTTAPIITSLVYTDVDNNDTISDNDTIDIIFDSDTNTPPNPTNQNRKYVNDLFTFTEVIGRHYTGIWTSPTIFTITNLDSENTTLLIGTTTVTPANVIEIFSADETSTASSATSPPLTIIDIVDEDVPDDTNDTINDTNDTVKNGGGCDNCTPPTLGYNSEGVKKVDNGICINDSCMDGGYFHTQYPMQNTTLHQPNIISTKYYEDHGAYNISLVQLGIGVQEIGSTINDSQVLIEVHLDYFANDVESPVIKEIKIIDPDGIINNATAAVSLVPCMENSNTSSCLKTDFSYSYGIVPTSAVLVSNAIDHDNNAVNNYFNDGLRVVDNSVIDTIGTVDLEPKCTTSSTQADRNNKCHFQLLINHEINRAQEYLDQFK